jgi:hypothetical protein
MKFLICDSLITCQNGLIYSKGCGMDCANSDICRYFISHWKKENKHVHVLCSSLISSTTENLGYVG